MKSNLFLGLIVFSFVVYSCGDAVQAPDSGLEKEIEQTWSEFSKNWEQEAVEELVILYTEDAMNIPPDGEIRTGREAIAQFYEFLFSNHLSSTYRHETKSLEVSGDMAIEYGEFTVNWVRNDSTPWTYRARSMTHWVKGENGKWHIQKFLFNQPPPEAENEAP